MNKIAVLVLFALLPMLAGCGVKGDPVAPAIAAAEAAQQQGG